MIPHQDPSNGHRLSPDVPMATEQAGTGTSTAPVVTVSEGVCKTLRMDSGATKAAKRAQHPSADVSCLTGQLEAEQRIRRDLAGHTCRRCAAALETAEIGKAGWAILRAGSHAGHRGLVVNVRCRCSWEGRIVARITANAVRREVPS